jgi:hypothetical protein
MDDTPLNAQAFQAAAGTSVIAEANRTVRAMSLVD